MKTLKIALIGSLILGSSVALAADKVKIEVKNTSSTELFTGGLQISPLPRVWGPVPVPSHDSKKVDTLVDSINPTETKYHIFVGQGISGHQHASIIKVTETKGTCNLVIDTGGLKSASGACKLDN